MAAATCRDDRTVVVRMEVPRDAAGDLRSGVRTKLDRIDGVEVAGVDVTGLEPRLNDLTVDATVNLRFAPDADVDDLTDLVGVHDARSR